MLFIISILIMLIFLLTIPLKIKIIYHNNKLNMYFLNFHWKKNIQKKKSKYNIKKNENQKYSNKFIIFKNTLDKIKFKPKAKIYISLNYDLEDAAHSAIVYGIIHSFLPSIYNYLNNFLNIKTFNYNIKPLFKNENFIDFKVKGIFYVNLVKIIYIYVLFKINAKDFK